MQKVSRALLRRILDILYALWLSSGILSPRMKRVFASADSAQVGLAQSILEAAGIACEVRNEAVHQALPGMPFIPELWALRDEDYVEACRLVRSLGSADAAKPD